MKKQRKSALKSKSDIRTIIKRVFYRKQTEIENNEFKSCHANHASFRCRVINL